MTATATITANEVLDKVIHCVECGHDFTWTAGEQQFFRERGYKYAPKRCKDCKRQTAKGTRIKVETAVTCDDCGQPTTVPFKPNNGKPVRCRSCFDKRKVS